MKKLLNKIKSIGSMAVLMIFILNFITVPPVVSAATIKLYAPASVNAAASSYGSISISWNGAAGASGYEVYRATSSSGSYMLVARTASRSYNNSGLTTGKTYYYKVRAYRTSGRSRIYSSYSYKVSSKPVPSAPGSVNAAGTSQSSINISWSGVAGASGYEVYRSNSASGGYSLVSSTTSTSFMSAGLSVATTYYYKVRAYRTISKTKYYGDFSAVIGGTTAPINVTAISLNKTASYLTVGDTDSLTAVIAPANATNKGIQWISSNNSLVAVDGTGKITAVGAGTAIITATTVDGSKTSSCTVTVNQPIINVTSIGLNKTTSDMNVGDIDTLTAVIAPTNSTNKAIKWTSSNNAVATVDSTGKITAVSTGTATITAATVDGNKTASCTLSVKPVNVTSVSLNKPVMTLILGLSDTIRAVIYPSNATNQAVTWTSSDNTIATVDNAGKVTPLKLGTVTITAATADGNKTARSAVTVSNVVARGIDVSRWQGAINWNLVKNDGIQFTMLRASYGDGSSRFANNGSDYMYEANYAGAKASGLAVGAYHYSYATTVEQAVTEANFFISKLQGKQFEYPVCVDIEDPCQGTLDKKTLTDITLTYLTMLKQAGYYPMVYASKYWFTSVLDDTALTSYDHWLAQYANSLTYTSQSGMWQYTSSGIVGGINGSVDMDASFIDYASKIKSLHLNGF